MLVPKPTYIYRRNEKNSKKSLRIKCVFNVGMKKMILTKQLEWEKKSFFRNF
jgi:hypothetical protein